MAVLTYPVSFMDKSDLQRIKFDIFVTSGLKKYISTKLQHTQMNRPVFHFVNTEVLFSLSDFCLENSNQ